VQPQHLPPSRVSLLLQRAQQGSESAGNELFAHLHVQMRDTARELIQHERADHTLQVSGLVNEACLKLWQQGIVQSAKNPLPVA